MSDPMSHAEVEDVLSSIRRLVSETSPKPSDNVEEPKTEKLVLTPSLRVSETFEAWAEDDEVEEQSPLQRVVEMIDAPEEEAPKAPDHLVLIAEHQAAEDEGEGWGELPEPADMGGLTTVPEGPLELPEIAPQATVDADVDPIPDWYIPLPTETEDEPEEAFDSAEDANEDDEGLDDDYDAEIADFSSVRTEALGDTAAELETLIQTQDDQWEPDDAGTDEYAGTEPPAMSWEDIAPAVEREADIEVSDIEPELVKAVVEEAVADLTPELVEVVAEDLAADVEPLDDKSYASEPVSETVASEETEAVFGEDDLLDEETLRDLVSEIVREELQGALGERITRNVRKLVRREIHRVLASQDFE